MNFDTGIAGFDAESFAEDQKQAPPAIRLLKMQRSRKVSTSGATRRAKAPRNTRRLPISLRPRKQRMIVFTPEIVYDTIKNWAISHYKLGDAQILRPFYPGGDYEHETYPDGCVVIDNPPFFYSFADLQIL